MLSLIVIKHKPSALSGRQCSLSRPGRFTPRVISNSIDSTYNGWVSESVWVLRKTKEYLVPAEHGTHIALEFVQQLLFIVTGISEILIGLQ